jgi:heme-degrading monooxygenase HmoA
MHASADIRTHALGAIAVIFAAQRSGQDAQGYAEAAAAMDALAALQTGFLGMDHACGNDGFGITVSYWADDACAKAWRDNPEHRAARDAGRGRWYAHYTLHVARIERGYAWP